MSAQKRLGRAGKRLWKAVTASLELDSEQLERLRLCCQLEDEHARMRAELEQAPLVVPGSAGQMVTHPLISQVRAHSQLIFEQLEVLSAKHVAPKQAETEEAKTLLDLQHIAALRRRGSVGG